MRHEIGAPAIPAARPAPSVTATGLHRPLSGARQAPVLVADRHALVGTALRLALCGRGVAAHELPVEDPATLLGAAAGFGTGLVLLDLSLLAEPGPDRFDADGPARLTLDADGLVSALRRQGKRVLALAGVDYEPATAAAVAAGAVGVLPKTITFEVLLTALDRAGAGHSLLTDDEREYWQARHHHHQQYHRSVTARLRRLSPRERVVLDWLSQGRRAAQIAEQQLVSVTTVRSQIRSILTKLEVSSQLEAVVLLVNGSGAAPSSTAPHGQLCACGG
jgi:DNA-binding NarL/FixJ family response regulator